MKLFEYKPTEYVDVLPDLPLEWMQQEIDKTQNKYDAKLNTVNDLNKEFYSMQAGAQTEEELKAINAEYSKRINDMVSGLTNTGYIPQTSADLAKFINEVSFDPRVKRIKEDREAYEIYQKNKLDPQYAGGVDMLQYRKPGTPYDPNYYKIIPASDSVAKSRTVAQTMHPSTIDGGKTWTVTDPFSGQTITRNSYEDAVGVSKERITAYTNANYVNWKTDPDSYADRVQLSGNNMAFWDTPEGKAVYDEKMRALEPLAYQTDASGKTGTQGTGTKPPTGPKEEKDDKIMNAQPGTTKFGDTDGFGVGHDGNKITDFFGVRDEENYQKREYLNASNEINKLTASGVPATDPRVVELQARKDHAKNETVVWDTWRRKIEGVDFNKIDAGEIARAQLEAKDYKEAAVKTLINAEAYRGLFGDTAWHGGKADSYIGKGLATVSDLFEGVLQAAATGNLDYIKMFMNSHEENAQLFLDDYEKEWKKNLTGPTAEIIKKYDEYKDYQTSGASYIVPEDKKNQVGTLVKNLLNKGLIAKNVINDNQVDAELQQKLFEGLKNEETQVYEFDRLSPEILLDEKDGPVLVLHGFRDEDGGVIALEYNLEDTPGIRKTLYDLLPEEERNKMTLFVQATESLKKAGRKKGEFTIPKYDKTEDVVKFSRHPIPGNPGKWEYIDADNNPHTSLSALIDAKSIEASTMDLAMKTLKDQSDTAFIKGDYKTGNELSEKLRNLVVAHRIERGIDPDTGKPMTDEEKEKYITKKQKTTPDRVEPTTPKTTTSSSGKQQPQTQSNSLGW